MEIQTENWKSAGIGTLERPRLEPKDVKILSVEKREGSTKDHRQYTKAIFSCQHPDREEPLQMSDLKIERKGKLEIRAAFVNLDAEGKIEKNSPIALMLQYYGAKTLAEMQGKNVKTAIDEKGYLVVKAY